MNQKIKVIFIPRWYPNRYDSMSGLFIQRQAEALTKYCDVAVIYVHPDPHCQNRREVDFHVENDVRVMRVYYRPPENSGSVLGRIINMWRFYRNNLQAIRSIREFSPDIIHAHILTRAGYVALKAGREHHCPVVISEHWSRYFMENNTFKGLHLKLITRFVVAKAAAMVAVSKPLRDAMMRCNLSNKVFRIIPNVVDTSLFYPQQHRISNPVKIFVHISCFDDKSKNISGFLRSVKALSEKRQDFRCLLIGNGPDWYDMKDYAGFLRIPEGLVEFPGVLNGTELSDVLRNADFSALSSLYETFGTVVIESLASGVPVVSTSVGISLEVITEDNGLLVPPGDESAMTRALDRALNNFHKFDRQKICAGIAGKFDKETIGIQLTDLYREVLSR